MASRATHNGAGGGVRHDQSQASGLGKEHSWPKSLQSLNLKYT
jgi:hypothetical protein